MASLLVSRCPHTPNRIISGEAARAAERQGFHSVWVTDATLSGYPYLDGLSVLGGLAAVTSTVHLGTSIFVIARRNPVLLAHTLATLDHMSRGRIIFGVGVGEKNLRPQEYAIAGVPVEKRGQITDEYLDLLRRLWAEPAVTHNGQFFQCQEITIEPKPAQGGKIPTWIGGKADASLRRAATYGDGWLPHLITAENYRRMWLQLGEYLSAAGRDPSEMAGGLYCFAAIGRTHEAAREILAPGVEAIYRVPFDSFEPVCLMGTESDWLEQIDQFAAAGVRHLNVMLFTQDLIEDVQAIGEGVLSHLPALSGKSGKPDTFLMS